MVKNILITALVLSAVLYSGYTYFQSSAHKHQQFLLEQSLFPDFMQKAREAGLPVQPKTTFLTDETFRFVITTPELDLQERENIRKRSLLIVQEWQQTQKEFHDHSPVIVFAEEVSSPTGDK